MGRRRRRVLTSLSGLVVATAIGVVAVDYVRFLQDPLRSGRASVTTFTIESGSSMEALSAHLARRGLLDRPLYFRLTARVRGDAARLQAGEYSIHTDSTPLQLLQKFVAGDVKRHELTLVEGWTFARALRAIRQEDALKHTLQDLSPEQIVDRLGLSRRHPEGLFFPDTYRFPRGFSDRNLLKRAHRRMQSVLRQQWRQRGDNPPLEKPYQALILASIIERETAVSSERARIAGVFVTRLQKGMRLQTDPTVIYGMGDDFDGNLTARDLRRDTPYNTYTRSGLPPTPIALPSQASIHAALHPERRGELYFVSTGDGSHVFSKTLKAHKAAVAKYQLHHD